MATPPQIMRGMGLAPHDVAEPTQRVRTPAAATRRRATVETKARRPAPRLRSEQLPPPPAGS